jgi:hypothetical protein
MKKKLDLFTIGKLFSEVMEGTKVKETLFLFFILNLLLLQICHTAKRGVFFY